MRWVVGLAASLAVAGTLVFVASSNRSHQAAAWGTQHRTGTTRLAGAVPLAVSRHKAALVGRHSPKSVIRLHFGLPLRDRAALDALIAEQAKTHTTLSRDELRSRFSPPSDQIGALRSWLEGKGFTVTHLSPDRLGVTATAPTTTVERALHVKINDYVRAASSYHAVEVNPYEFYANTTDPVVPAFLGIQTISGLSDVDRFFTSAQLSAGSTAGTKTAHACGDDEATINPLCIDVRSGGYFPIDLR